MKKIRIFAAVLFALGAGSSIVSLPANAQDLKTKAEAEGKLMMYATFTAADSKTLLDAFKQAYPKIDAAYYRSNDAALMERFVSENRGGQNLCDVIVTTSFYGNAIKKRGLFTPYDSPERKFFRDGYKDPQSHWTSTYTNYGAFGYNTRAVAKTSVPKSFNDLLKPEWKGQITIEGRAYEWFGTTIKTMGEEKAWHICASWPSRRNYAPAAISSLSWSPRESSKARSAATRKRSKY